MSGILEIPSSCPESDVRLNADFAGFDGVDIDAVHEPQRWAEYERRKGAWKDDNPGALPCELQDFCARLAEELGL